MSTRKWFGLVVGSLVWVTLWPAAATAVAQTTDGSAEVSAEASTPEQQLAATRARALEQAGRGNLKGWLEGIELGESDRGALADAIAAAYAERWAYLDEHRDTLRERGAAVREARKAGDEETVKAAQAAYFEVLNPAPKVTAAALRDAVRAALPGAAQEQFDANVAAMEEARKERQRQRRAEDGEAAAE